MKTFLRCLESALLGFAVYLIFTTLILGTLKLVHARQMFPDEAFGSAATRAYLGIGYYYGAVFLLILFPCLMLCLLFYKYAVSKRLLVKSPYVWTALFCTSFVLLGAEVCASHETVQTKTTLLFSWLADVLASGAALAYLNVPQEKSGA